VVEDPLIATFLHALLTRNNFEAICVSVGKARAMLRDSRAGIDLLITNRPLAFIARPDVPLLYLAAAPGQAEIRAFRRALPLAKPFHPRDLLECISQLLS
jgi:hypothetical protein